WGIELVQQAEGRGVELEEREHQRDGGEGLLAAGEQMNAGVALSRRLRHDLHAGIEDLLAGHDELRFAAAEKGREERAEVAVHALEGLAQELARLAVDPADRVFQRRTASSRSADCESRKPLRSRLVRSSSTA